tara:strand:+ start:749 stop:1786 length:1038 start_codon:yes stop_codon:yes gene_type:complete
MSYNFKNYLRRVLQEQYSNIVEDAMPPVMPGAGGVSPVDIMKQRKRLRPTLSPGGHGTARSMDPPDDPPDGGMPCDPPSPTCQQVPCYTCFNCPDCPPPANGDWYETQTWVCDPDCHWETQSVTSPWGQEFPAGTWTDPNGFIHTPGIGDWPPGAWGPFGGPDYGVFFPDQQWLADNGFPSNMVIGSDMHLWIWCTGDCPGCGSAGPPCYIPYVDPVNLPQLPPGADLNNPGGWFQNWYDSLTTFERILFWAAVAAGVAFFIDAYGQEIWDFLRGKKKHKAGTTHQDNPNDIPDGDDPPEIPDEPPPWWDPDGEEEEEEEEDDPDGGDESDPFGWIPGGKDYIIV